MGTRVSKKKTSDVNFDVAVSQYTITINTVVGGGSPNLGLARIKVTKETPLYYRDTGEYATYPDLIKVDRITTTATETYYLVTGDMNVTKDFLMLFLGTCCIYDEVYVMCDWGIIKKCCNMFKHKHSLSRLIKWLKKGKQFNTKNIHFISGIDNVLANED